MTDDHHAAGGPLDALNARGLTAKREYVRGLEQRRDPEALSLLVECLCDESWFLRDLAEQTFFRMGEAHVGPLLPLLSGGLWYTRLSAARLLGRLGYRPAVPALLELCDDPNETASLAARESLLAVARQRGSARLAHALNRLKPDLRRQRLAEIAERDRAMAKNLERLMADVELMEAENPDRLVDVVETAQTGEKAGGPDAAPPSKPPVASRAPAASNPPVPVVSKPPAAQVPTAPKSQAATAPPTPTAAATQGQSPPAAPASTKPRPTVSTAKQGPPAAEPVTTKPKPAATDATQGAPPAAPARPKSTAAAVPQELPLSVAPDPAAPKPPPAPVANEPPPGG